VKLQHVGNACCTYSKDDYTILCDPWLVEGAFEGSWMHYPPLISKPSDFFSVNAIYISHLHPDHYDEATLKQFPKHIPIFFLDREPNYLRKKLDGLGFTTLIPIKDQETTTLGPFQVTMFAPFTGHLFHETTIGNPIDSAILVRSGEFQVLNANDNAPSIDAAKMLREKYGKMDIVQLVDSCAGPYPACFTNLTPQEKFEERDRILTRHLDLMIECAKILEAKYFQPFAGHYQLGGALMHLNPYLAVMEPEDVAHYVAKRGVTPLLLNEKDSFDLETKTKTFFDRGEYPIEREDWEASVKDAPYSYDDLPEMGKGALWDLFETARHRFDRKKTELGVFPKWNINVNGRCVNVCLDEPHAQIDFTMPEKLFAAILQRKIHWNNAEVGCHMRIHRSPNVYDPDIHLLLCHLHV
jgi:UDP-MurNAc hydroxylase